jgi:peptidoglycan/xylan/chitin deacetylase (PgdA/CDA1 family)
MADIEKCSAIIEQIIGEKPVFFRPPFGVTNPRYRSVLKKLGLTSIGWTGRSFDTVLQEKTSLVKRINKIVSNHSILLFHDNLDVTVRALPEIIDNCRKQGVKIISLQNLINIEPYA